MTINGTLTATGGTSSDKSSYGIWCRDDLTVNGAMNATGGDGIYERLGCNVNGKLIPGAGIIVKESDDGTTWSAADPQPKKKYVRAYTMSVTKPEVIDDLTYKTEDGEPVAQDLITAGTLADGVEQGTKLEYAIGEDAKPIERNSDETFDISALKRGNVLKADWLIGLLFR